RHRPLPGQGSQRRRPPDVSPRSLHDALPIFIDWKTGSVKSESHREQAGVYILYAHRAYGVPDESIEFVLADLGGGGRNVQLPGRSEEHTSELQSRENLV